MRKGHHRLRIDPPPLDTGQLARVDEFQYPPKNRGPHGLEGPVLLMLNEKNIEFWQWIASINEGKHKRKPRRKQRRSA